MSKSDPSSAGTQRVRAARAEALREALSRVGVDASAYVYPANGNAKLVLDPANSERPIQLLGSVGEAVGNLSAGHQCQDQ